MTDRPPTVDWLDEGAATPLPELFDRHYLAFWEAELGADRSVREHELVMRLGGLRAGHRVLDVACGYGRMSIPLAAVGVEVTGLDLSEQLLDEARSRASSAGVSPRFLAGDMRDLSGFTGFDSVLLWFTSFGYFDDETNARVLREARNCLAPGGRLLMETRHWDRMQRRFDPVTVRSAGDDLLIEHHTYEAATGIQWTRQTLVVDGTHHRRVSSVRRYGFPELAALCRAAGFRSVEGFDESGEPLGPDSDRCVVVAVR
ncbi:SAM-dependent methyltransferase [Streptomyces sp. NPDC088812]|uniref:SAM-dependent methyltransferase n=1 Tax=Streptomyces sp. NPDC088812 TaxID=3365905 RepID=UPI003827281B